MKTFVLSLIVLALTFNIRLSAQNIPDVNLLFDFELVNCQASSPDISTNFSLSSADNTVWNVGFIMLTLNVNETVLGTPPQMVNPPAGWNTDVYRENGQWQIELVNPNGGGIAIGNSPVDVFSLQWPYLQEGAVFSIVIADADLGVNNSLEDEQLHYPNGLQISGSDDCASQAGEIDFYWYNPVLTNCPYNPIVTTPIEFASHVPGEIWQNGFVQLVIQQNNNVLGQPRIVNPIPGFTTDVYAQGPEWVIEMTSGNSVPITDNGVRFFDLEWDVLQEGVPFAIVLNDIDLGLNVPNEFIHRPNGNVISGNASCPCHVKIQNVSSYCSSACSGTGTVFFDIDIQNGPGGNFSYTVGNVTKTISLPPGDIIVLDEVVQNVSFAHQPVTISSQFANSNCGDVAHVPQINCGPCSININSINASACRVGSNTYDIEINVTTQNLCSGLVYVQIDGGPITPNAPAGNKITLTGMPADGAQHSIIISDDVLGIGCSDQLSYTAPISCQISSTNSTMHLDPVHASLSPNPVAANRKVHVQSETIINRVKVYNMAGMELINVQKDDRSFDLDLVDFQTGMYLVRLETAEGFETQKLVIRQW